MITDVEQRKYDRWQKGQDENVKKKIEKKFNNVQVSKRQAIISYRKNKTYCIQFSW